jgi:uncharacterized protein (UPF0212 family)
MNRKDLIQNIRKRAAALDQSGDGTAISRFAFATDDDTLGLSSGSVVDAGPSSAVFCVSDESLIDRDGDLVEVGDGHTSGVMTDNFFRSGASWYLNHDSRAGEEIGTSIDPATGKLDVWRQGSKLYARVHFYTDIGKARFIASQVAKRRLRSCSIAFVPLSAERRSDDFRSKARPYNASPALPPGFTFHLTDLTEISLVGVGSSPAALLQVTGDKACPLVVAKSLGACGGGKCFSRWIPPRPKTAADYLREIRDSYADTDRFFADLPRRRWLNAELDRVTRNFVAGFNKVLGESGGSAGGYAVGNQADVESPLNDVTDRYGKVKLGVTKCPACNKEIQASHKFCMHCGAEIKGFETDASGPVSETGESQLVDAGHVPPDALKSAGQDACPECGEEIKDHWKICPACEAKLPVRAGSGNVVSPEMSDPDKEEILQRYAETGDDEHADDGMRDRYRLPQLP